MTMQSAVGPLYFKLSLISNHKIVITNNLIIILAIHIQFIEIFHKLNNMIT